jgi:hypothetical protein
MARNLLRSSAVRTFNAAAAVLLLAAAYLIYLK